MYSMRQKMKDMMSAARAKSRMSRAKAETRAEAAAARTPIERDIAVERAKAKQAQAKVDLHQEKAQHRAETAVRHRRRRFFGLCGSRHNRHATAGMGPMAAPAGTYNASAYPTSAYPSSATTAYKY